MQAVHVAVAAPSEVKPELQTQSSIEVLPTGEVALAGHPLAHPAGPASILNFPAGHELQGPPLGPVKPDGHWS